ncbi:MAG: glycerol kinase GlpK [Sumerlaeia bacterium]
MNYILALDQGTTTSRAILFNRNGAVEGVAQKELVQIFPKPGWVEHDPNEIWSSQLSVATEVLSRTGVSTKEISGIGITNQRETTVLWNRTTGQPLCNAIVWQDRRTASRCDDLKSQGFGELIRQKTGLLVDSYFSATKLEWMLAHVEGARQAAQSGALAFGTVDSWLVWKLTGGKVHATDVTNASRTMLYNIHTQRWDDDLLSLFNIPTSILPEVYPSIHNYGQTGFDVFAHPVAVGGVAGDQQAALFGQLCTQAGMVKNTYGTGCFMLMNTGGAPIESSHKLLTTVAWDLGEKTDYALEGSIFMGGAVVQWLRDGLGLIRESQDCSALAASVPDAEGVYLVPAFAGLGAPHWDPYARGSLFGLTRGTTAAHLVRAALEAIAYQVADVLDCMVQDSTFPVPELRVDGGACKNDLLLQFQADLLRVPVVRPTVTETTALGAAYMAGLCTGFWSTQAQLESLWKVERIFEPLLPLEVVQQKRHGWNKAVARSKDWADHA